LKNMKRDRGASEVIAEIFLIFITVVAAGIVLSAMMITPSPSIPVLEYYGCAVENTEHSHVCLVHIGGETLHNGTYFLRGYDASQQPLDILECTEFVANDFKMGRPICVKKNNINFIQLYIIDGSRQLLHGTVYVDVPCPGEIVHHLEV